MAEIPPVCDFGWRAKEFNLPSVDGKKYTLEEVSRINGLLIMFICNHCPYVLAILDRIVRDASDLQKLGVGIAAISSNDVISYPEDSFDNMEKLAANHNFTFPYMYDETQEVAKLYNAVCTPDFFGYNKDLELQYRGRVRELKKLIPVREGDSDLLKAMTQIAETNKGPENQIPSAGCGIKWKNN